MQYLSYIVRVGSCRGNERFLADVLLGQWDFVLSTRWRLLEGVVEGVRREASVIWWLFLITGRLCSSDKGLSDGELIIFSGLISFVLCLAVRELNHDEMLNVRMV